MFSQLHCIAGTAKEDKEKNYLNAAEKGWSLDAQICEQQGGKREA